MTNSKKDAQRKEGEIKKCPDCNVKALPFLSEYGFYHKCPKCSEVL